MIVKFKGKFSLVAFSERKEYPETLFSPIYGFTTVNKTTHDRELNCSRP